MIGPRRSAAKRAGSTSSMWGIVGNSTSLTFSRVPIVGGRSLTRWYVLPTASWRRAIARTAWET